MSAVVLRGDAAHLPLPDGSVDLICTSPPYYALRAYSDGGEVYAGQIGSEATPQEYLEALWRCTAEWVRVLKPHGSIFVVLGDKYSGAQQQTHGRQSGESSGEFWRRTDPSRTGIPNKSLMLLPERYRIGCVDRMGLTAREVIEWSKPNGLPESVRDRCRRSHEDMVHLVKRPDYFSALDEIREGYAPGTAERYRSGYKANSRGSSGASSSGVLLNMAAGDGGPSDVNPLGKLPGSVWEIPSAPLIVPAHLGVDHFAAYPPELCRRAILGWSPPGICVACGQGRRPVASSVRTLDGEPRDDLPAWADSAAPRRTPNGAGHWRFKTDRRHLGYACACPDASAPTRPALVADPFGGTGTTAMTASVLGRIGITFDRSMSYCRLARWRTSDPGERARALGVPKPPPISEGQGSLFDEAS